MLSMSAHMNIGWRWIGDSRNLGVGCRSIVRAGSLVQLSSSVYAGTKTEEDEKSEVIFGHAKEVKIIRWNEYDGGLWSSTPVDRGLRVLEGWRCQRAGGGWMWHEFPDPQKGCYGAFAGS